MAREISTERKSAFALGTGLMVLGGLLFGSTFVTSAMNFGDFSNFEADARSGMFRAFGGMLLLIVGGIVRGIGARGLAGSGIVLDPEQARRDLEPYSRMAGGMLKDVLEEAEMHPGGETRTVVAVKCPSCGKLNEADSKFCQECGVQL